MVKAVELDGMPPDLREAAWVVGCHGLAAAFGTVVVVAEGGVGGRCPAEGRAGEEGKGQKSFEEGRHAGYGVVGSCTEGFGCSG